MPEIRTYRTTARIAALIAATVFAAACSSDTAPSASQFDVSAALNAMSVPGASSATSSAASASGTSSMMSTADADAPAIVPSACSYSATSQSFTCPATTVNGLTIDRSYTLLDAQGNSQSAPDKATTDGIATLTTVAGTVAMGSGSMTVSGVRHMKLTGLLSGNRVLDGDDNTTATGTMSGTSSSFTMTMATQTTKIALPPAGSTSKYPLSGSFSMNMSMTSGTLPTTSTQMVLTFNGSSTATMTIKTSAGGVQTSLQTCTLDLTGKTAMSCTPTA